MELGKKLDEECDPSQPSRFISEALRVASSIEKNIQQAVMLPQSKNGVYRVNQVPVYKSASKSA
jgi:hypothetical protein